MILAGSTLLPAAALAAPCAIGMPVAGEYSSGFGYRGRGYHPGVDIRAPIGSQVRAAAGGTVVHAGRYYGYGIMVEVEHRDGTRARYAHLAGVGPGVSAGRQVLAGQPVGSVGRTGRTTGPHLHVELRRDGRATDPWPWLTRTACAEGIEVAEAQR
ncbi:M23 family metallopeptidase [Roseomonas soli]|uniref:M23 family metallopeptidase n=2 Tax=Neoroseomonas soli TaxID=1081025 RepID=A0A9X9X0G2_9PROT|nr:M23 family metallopeptidase [Neoroseomonas soli]